MSQNKIMPMSGFPEWLPEQRAVEAHFLDVIRTTFERHGFVGIETRAVEPVERLLGKGGDADKEIYGVSRLAADADERDAETALGLHFDLTVPFARYVLENSGKLQFPFRRYQIQKVWRGERPQDGRYREFTQADIDIVGRGELPFHHDVEVTRVMLEALGTLEFLPGFQLQVNNRKLIQGFYTGLGAPDLDEVMRLVDKLDKLPEEKVHELLIAEAGLTSAQADACLALSQIAATDTSFVEQVRALGVEHPLLDQGLAELAQLVEACQHLVTDRIRIVADLKIARGLDYYTGTVFETRLDGYESMGSICSGGRYDALASDGKTTYPGVGISLGVSRVLVPLVGKGKLNADRSVPSAVLVSLTDETARADADALAGRFRANGVPCEVAATAAKFGKQIRYAERRGIPWVAFTTEAGVEVKDIRSGEQQAVDPATWTPPEADLRPAVSWTD